MRSHTLCIDNRTALRMLYSVTFEYFSSASQGGKGYSDVVLVTQDQQGLLYNRW